MTYVLRWGIMATGGIAELFIRDITLDPKSRGVTDVDHRPVAVASRSLDKAQSFISEHAPPELQGSIKPYGSYSELLSDPDVDCVYIATPASSHYDNTLEALRAGKNVLCEKPFTVNAAQAKHLLAVAKEKDVFLMEGVWTRFFPLALSFKRLLHEEKLLGRIHRLYSDFSVEFPLDPSHRMYTSATAGGALLDLGVYMTVWTMLTCYHHPDNDRRPPDVMKAVQFRSPISPDVDESTSVITLWENPKIMAIGTVSMMTDSPPECAIRVQGEKGELIIPIHGSRPEKIIVRLKAGGMGERVYNFPIPGQGLFWEADAVARDIRDGKKFDNNYPVEESIFVMELMDEIRRQNSLKFPEEIEHVEPC
ncbi:hypothetical protein V1517DRAFT_326017 [Lipomyces orientalis]|uniref:Uncharacterized protein n=1 Tax=Lipomyces orientalis TaxID=1233043 RepID=A0ACC3TK55_9ASCO